MTFEAIHKQLMTVGESVAGWLRFAEAKNAALLTLNASFLSAYQRGAMSVSSQLALGCSTTALALCMFSFLPKTARIANYWGRKRDDELDNLLFFTDISKYSPSSYARSFCLRYYSMNIDSLDAGSARLLDDQANQIVANSCIAKAKFSFFSVAMWFSIFGLASLLYFWVL